MVCGPSNLLCKHLSKWDGGGTVLGGAGMGQLCRGKAGAGLLPACRPPGPQDELQGLHQGTALLETTPLNYLYRCAPS